jgi:hypothetical protein
LRRRLCPRLTPPHLLNRKPTANAEADKGDALSLKDLGMARERNLQGPYDSFTLNLRCRQTEAVAVELNCSLT